MREDPKSPDTPPPVWLQYVLLMALAALVARAISAWVALVWR